MDETATLTGATVSLPQAKRTYGWVGFTVDDSSDVVSKPTIERMFTEELSFGSKPKISVPKRVNYHNGVYQGIPQTMMRPNTLAMGLDDGQSKEVFQMLDIHPRRAEAVFISLPTSKPFRKLVYKHPRKPSGMHQDRKPSGKFQRGGKGKEVEVRSPVSAGPAAASSRKPSAQNGIPGAAATTPAENNHAGDGNKRGGARRGGRRPQAPQAPQQPVKSA